MLEKTRPGNRPKPSLCHQLCDVAEPSCASPPRAVNIELDQITHTGNEISQYWWWCVGISSGARRQRDKRTKAAPLGWSAVSLALCISPDECMREDGIVFERFVSSRLTIVRKISSTCLSFWTLNPHFGITGKRTRVYLRRSHPITLSKVTI